MEDASAIARDYVEAWNRRDFDRVRELLHPQYTYTSSDGHLQQGPEAGLAVGMMYANAFPDGKMDIDHITASGDTAVIECTAHGTHRGELMGIAPTGRTLQFSYCRVLQLEDSKIKAEREYADTLHMMRQLGIITAPSGMTA